VRSLLEILRELVLLAILGLCLRLFPKTALTIEAFCGVGTIALFLVERAMA
jgi:hypothetical protein